MRAAWASLSSWLHPHGALPPPPPGLQAIVFCYVSWAVWMTPQHSNQSTRATLQLQLGCVVLCCAVRLCRAIKHAALCSGT